MGVPVAVVAVDMYDTCPPAGGEPLQHRPAQVRGQREPLDLTCQKPRERSRCIDFRRPRERSDRGAGEHELGVAAGLCIAEKAPQRTGVAREDVAVS